MNETALILIFNLYYILIKKIKLNSDQKSLEIFKFSYINCKKIDAICKFISIKISIVSINLYNIYNLMAIKSDAVL